MNREIKFRAWGINTKKLYKPFELKDIMKRLIESDETIAKFELMQYTGLKDKNGKEIYEGDIIEQNDKIGEVTFANGKFQLYKNVEFGSGFCDIDYRSVVYVEIIGNIYKNPELLK